MGASYLPSRIKIVHKTQSFILYCERLGGGESNILAFPGSASDRAPSVWGGLRGVATSTNNRSLYLDIYEIRRNVILHASQYPREIQQIRRFIRYPTEWDTMHVVAFLRNAIGGIAPVIFCT